MEHELVFVNQWPCMQKTPYIIAEANHLVLDDQLPISATVFGQRNSPYLFSYLLLLLLLLLLVLLLLLLLL